MRSRSRALLVPLLVPVLLVLLLSASACSEDPAFLSDEAACPGADCTPDTQDRVDAIAALDRVTEVVSVRRSYGFDHGSSSGAQVKARVSDRAQARALAMQVLVALDSWPDHSSDTSDATVVADPARTVRYVARDSLDLGVFDACSPAECEEAVSTAGDRLSAEVGGLADVAVSRRGGNVLRVTGTAAPDQATLAARGVRGFFFDLGLQVADRLEVTVTARGPLELTLRRDGDLVCEQPPGASITCDEDNSVSLAQ